MLTVEFRWQVYACSLSTLLLCLKNVRIQCWKRNIKKASEAVREGLRERESSRERSPEHRGTSAAVRRHLGLALSTEGSLQRDFNKRVAWSDYDFKRSLWLPWGEMALPNTHGRGRPGRGTAAVWTRAVAVEVARWVWFRDTSEDLLMAKMCDAQEEGFGLSKRAYGSIS